MKKKILIVTLAIVLIAGILSGCTEENAKPEASFTYSAENYYVDTEIQFNDTSTTDDDLTYLWDFGDGETSTEENPTHIYEEKDTYAVTLTVTDTANQSDATTKQLEITLKDIAYTAETNDDFETLYVALDVAGLVSTLEGEGPFTVFAPTNAAFDALNQTWLTNLLSDTTNLTNVLLYHVLDEEVMSSALTNTTVETLEGTNLTIVVDTNVTVNGVTVTTADIECNNGVIHVIGEVLLPESVPGPEE